MRNRLYILSLCICLALSAEARMFEPGEQFFFKAHPQNATWWGNEGKRLCAYFFNSSTDNSFAPAFAYSVGGDVMAVDVPMKGGAATNWDKVILTRHNAGSPSPSWGNRCDQTGDLVIYHLAEYNYIYNFGKNSDWCDWKVFAPFPTGTPESILTPEDDIICSDAQKDGQIYVLAPKDYDYINTYSHAWYRYDGSTWTLLDDFSAHLELDGTRNAEGDSKDIHLTPDGPNSVNYYYLWASHPSKRRMIKVSCTADCSKGSPKITSFEVALSEPNVTDGTCAIDGLVAFDDADGELWITCNNGIETVVKIATPVSPQLFHMEGLDANNINYTFTAGFQGGSGVSATKSITTKPADPSSVITHPLTTLYTLQSTTLVPDNAPTSYLIWTNSDDDTEINISNPSKSPSLHRTTYTAPQSSDISGYTKELKYAAIERNEPEAAPENMLKNSGFESTANWESDFNEWTYEPNFYDTHSGYSRGFCLAQDAHIFAKTYNVVTPHEGSYFGLFDSDDSGATLAAWRTTTAQNEDLKLTEGVTYLFSFWVANINNFGEMDNAAKLQFQISYDGGAVFHDLGNPVDLANFRDNRWHCGSAHHTALQTSSNIVLRLINLNTINQNRGNDFALDDIRFQAVTSRTQNVAGYELFPIKVLKCQIDDATFTQVPAATCGATTADVNYQVSFHNRRGDLYIYEGTNQLAHIAQADIADDATSYTGTLTAQPLDGALHTLHVYFDDNDLSNPEHLTDGGYFTYQAATIPAMTVVSANWSTPDCDNTLTTLTVELSYRNQNGTINADVNGMGTLQLLGTIQPNDNNDNNLTLTLSNIPADGNYHDLNIAFTGTHACALTYSIPDPAPYMPQISKVEKTIHDHTCGDPAYQITIGVNFSNSQGHRLFLTDGNGNDYTFTSITNTDTYAEHTFTIPFPAVPTNNTFKAYFEDAETCKDLSSHLCEYSAPVRRKLQVTPTLVNGPCNSTDYQLQLTIDYVYQDGTLHVTVDDSNEQLTTDFSHNDPTEQHKQISISNLPADGKTHKYSVWFDGVNSCSKTNVDYLAPYIPQVNSLTATIKPYSCSATEYTVRLSASVFHSYSHDLVITDGTTENTRTIPTSDITTIVEQDFTFPMVTADQWRTFYTYFVGAEACQTEPQNTVSFKEPSTPSIKTNLTQKTVIDCPTTAVEYELSVDYFFQNGSLETYWDGGEHIITTIEEDKVSLAQAVVLMPALPLDGKTRNLNLRFTGDHGCSTTIPVTTPLLPKINSFSLTPTTPAFGDDKYDIIVSLNCSGAVGQNITIESIDLTPAVQHTQAVPESGTLTYTFPGIQTDNGITHQFRAFFPDAIMLCPNNQHFTSPKLKELKNISATVTPLGCNDAFEVNITGEFNLLTGNIVVNDLTTGTELYNQPAPSGSMFDLTTISQPADGKEHTLQLYFTSESTHPQLFSIKAPELPTLNIAASEFLKPDCQGATAIDINLSHTNHTGDLVLTDENDIVLTTFTAPAPNTTYTYHWDMQADGQTHTAKAYFTSLTSCIEQISFTAPTASSMTITPTISNEDLCDGTITLDIAFTTQGAKGELVYIDDIDGEKSTISTPTAAFNATPHTHRLLTDRTRTIRAWFSDRPDCVYTATYQPKGSGEISMSNYTFGEVNCEGKVSATLTLRSFIAGVIVITDQNGQELHRQTITDSAPDHLNPVITTITLNDLDAEQGNVDNSLTLNAYYEDRPSCVNTLQLIAPHHRYVKAITQTHTTPFCKETVFDLNLSVTVVNAMSDIVLREGITELARISVAGEQLGEHTFSTTIKGLADGDVHTINAYLYGADDCTTPMAFIAPEPNTCIEYYDTLCVGQAYEGHGVKISPLTAAGDYEYQEKDSTVFLHVVDLPEVVCTQVPTICSDESTITVPLSVKRGEPNSFDVVYDASNPIPIAPVVSEQLTSDNITLSLPDSLKAGTYRLTFAFYHSATTCTTEVDYSFYVAQSGLIYSKWNDVLLINNADEKFVAYQWYKDSELLAGETNQHLYNTQGLDGTYYCLITLKDGTTIQTCEVRFDEVPRSADLKTAVQVAPKKVGRGMPITVSRESDETAVICIYDATGRLISTTTTNEQLTELTAPHTQGLYIVSLTTASLNFKDKIMVE